MVGIFDFLFSDLRTWRSWRKGVWYRVEDSSEMLYTTYIRWRREPSDEAAGETLREKEVYS